MQRTSSGAFGPIETRAGEPCDPICDEEAHTEDTGQLIGVLAHDTVRGGTVVLGDPLDQVPQAVRGQEQMELPADAQRVPRGGGLDGATRADADGTEGAMGVAVDGLECLGLAVAPHQVPGLAWPPRA